MDKPNCYVIVDNLKIGQKGTVLWECKACGVMATVKKEDGACVECGEKAHNIKYALTEET